MSVGETKYQPTNMKTLLIATFVFILSFCLDSFIEWAVHRFPMHKKLPGPLFRFLFWHHMEVHHPKFSGANYEHHGNHERDTIPFPIWVGPILILTAISPFWLLSFMIDNYVSVWSSFVAALVYYACFEGFHQLMHMPDYPLVRFIRSSKWFMWLNEHHKIHHEKASFNFNLVFPLADWILGTLLTRFGIRH